MATDNLARLVDILERAGVGGTELAEFADEINGEKDPETGLRGKSKSTTGAKSES